MHGAINRLLTGTGAVAAAICLAAPVGAVAAIDDAAGAQLRGMSVFLAAQPRFSIAAAVDQEVVLSDGQKLHHYSNGVMNLSRAEGIHVVRDGYNGRFEVFVEPSRISLLGRDGRIYYQVPNSGTLDGALDTFRRVLRVDAPAAELLHSDAYGNLVADARSGAVVGQEVVDGVRCNVLAFRTDASDWQIWIEDGPRPLPHRYRVVSKRIPGAPAFTVDLTWNLAPSFSRSEFSFAPPSGAVLAKNLENDQLGDVFWRDF
jgi:hypothetical protein